METLQLLKKDVRETVREYAYRVLYENIMKLWLVPGTAMSEQELSSVLEVSRTPVREAFIRLAQKGLLEVLPQRGTFVSKINTAQLAEFRFLRLTVEKAIIEIACSHFPEEWMDKVQQCIKQQEECLRRQDINGFFDSDNCMHSLLFQGCGKFYIWDLIENANLDYMRVRVLNLTAEQQQMNMLISQHQAIIEAILRHDVRRGTAILEEHINKGGTDLELLRKQYPRYFE